MTPKDVIAQAGKDWRTELENKFKVARIRREEIDEIVMEKFISELISSYTKDLLRSVEGEIEKKIEKLDSISELEIAEMTEAEYAKHEGKMQALSDIITNLKQ